MNNETNNDSFEVSIVGYTCWKDVNNQLHRTDGPSLKWSEFDYRWYFHGKLHRINGPAVCYNKKAKKTPLLAAGMNWQTEKEHLTNLKYDSILYVMTSLKEWIDELSKFFFLC